MRGKLFSYKNGQVIAHAITPSTALKKLESIQYQEISPCTMAIIKTELQETPTIDQGNQNYIIKANSALSNNNPTMVDTYALCTKCFILLIITNNSDNKIYIPKVYP